jgi:hypothetical protein
MEVHSKSTALTIDGAYLSNPTNQNFYLMHQGVVKIEKQYIQVCTKDSEACIAEEILFCRSYEFTATVISNSASVLKIRERLWLLGMD